MNIVYSASNFTVGIGVIIGSFIAMYMALNMFGTAATVFLAGMIAVVIFGWVLL